MLSDRHVLLDEIRRSRNHARNSQCQENIDREVKQQHALPFNYGTVIGFLTDAQLRKSDWKNAYCLKFRATLKPRHLFTSIRFVKTFRDH